MSTGKKIPDMFFRALKRKPEAMADSTNMSPKRNCSDEKILPSEKTDTLGVAIVSTVENTPKNMDSNRKLNLYFLMKNPSWKVLLKNEFEKPYMKEIESFLDQEYKKGVKIFPPKEEIFSAFNLTNLKDIRVVIIGQDPYHDDNQAHGLSFSVKLGVNPPPSLKNIYKELCNDIPNFNTPDHGYLLGWARQGVFMLNASLTVQAHKANSHATIGWQTFTDNIIKLISKNAEHVVFLLWGGFAHKKEALVDKKKHAVVKTAHPSPLSARLFTGCKCFSKVNELLTNFKAKPIDWNDLKKSYDS